MLFVKVFTKKVLCRVLSDRILFTFSSDRLLFRVLFRDLSDRVFLDPRVLDSTLTIPYLTKSLNIFFNVFS